MKKTIKFEIEMELEYRDDDTVISSRFMTNDDAKRFYDILNTQSLSIESTMNVLIRLAVSLRNCTAQIKSDVSDLVYLAQTLIPPIENDLPKPKTSWMVGAIVGNRMFASAMNRLRSHHILGGCKSENDFLDWSTREPQ